MAETESPNPARERGARPATRVLGETITARTPAPTSSKRALTRLGAAIACVLVIGLVQLVGASASRRDEPCTEPQSCWESLQLSSGGTLRVFRTRPLAPDPAISRVAVVVHGNRRDADRYFSRLVAAGRAEGRLRDTLLLAPFFPTRDDAADPAAHYWSSGGWKIGHRSRDAARTSSFEVMDELLARLCPAGREVFASLRTLAIVGHSAGGQFVQRYLAGGRGCPDAAIEVRYVVMNPSSYMYPDPRRRVAEGRFETPKTACLEYDDYKYGLRDLNAYMKRVGARRLRTQLFERHAVYLAGTADTRRGKSLDKSCRADLQGPNRLARHENYRDYAALFEGWRGSRFVTVPQVGHDSQGMLMSEPARTAVFR